MPDPDEQVAQARRLVLEQFRWDGGHADVWAVFRDAAAFGSVVAGLVAPYRASAVTTVAGVESRGFLLGGACAAELGVGFTALRKAGALFPGPKHIARTAPDYRGRSSELAVQRAALGPTDRVLLVDDWIETGSQARAAAELIARCAAELIGIAVLVDQLADGMRSELPPVTALVTYAQLPTDPIGPGGPSMP